MMKENDDLKRRRMSFIVILKNELEKICDKVTNKMSKKKKVSLY